MVLTKKPEPPRVLVVGNHCHDVLFHQNGAVKAESLGGAASFISAVLQGLSVPFHLVSFVGSDFRYPEATASHPPSVSPYAPTTLFHAVFPTGGDRLLTRVAACDPIRPEDLPEGFGRFELGMAVAVAGEILPETLERMLDLCDVVLADVQALIREFRPGDGLVRHVAARETAFCRLLPRLGVVKASSEEAGFLDVEGIQRGGCCVVVTEGREGCRVLWGEAGVVAPFPACQVDPTVAGVVAPFPACQVDPTGAGDSFLGGFVAGLVHGLCVPDAALVGNLFGSLAVEHIGLPSFDPSFLQRVKDEVQKRRIQYRQCEGCDGMLKFLKLAGHEQFHSSLMAARLLSHSSVEDCKHDQPDSPADIENGTVPHLTELHL